MNREVEVFEHRGRIFEAREKGEDGKRLAILAEEPAGWWYCIPVDGQPVHIFNAEGDPLQVAQQLFSR